MFIDQPSYNLLKGSLTTVEYWSVITPDVSIPAVAANVAFPGIITVANLPANMTVIRAHLMVRCREVVDLSGAPNGFAGAQVIQIQEAVAAVWQDAITIPALAFAVAANGIEPGMEVFGDLNVVATVTGNAVYNCQIALAQALGATLELFDVQAGVRITYQTN